MATSTRLHELADRGQGVRIDFLSRELLRSGGLARLTRRQRFRRHLEPDHLRQGLAGGDARDGYAQAKHFHEAIARPNLLASRPACSPNPMTSAIETQPST